MGLCTGRISSNSQEMIVKQASIKKEALNILHTDVHKIYDIDHDQNLFEGTQTLAQHKLSGTQYFIEYIPLNHTHHENLVCLLMKSVQKLNDYAGIQRIHEVYTTSSGLYIVKEQVCKQTLKQFIQKQKKSLKEVEVLFIFCQMLRILEQLNLSQIVHGRITTGSFAIEMEGTNIHVTLIDLLRTANQDAQTEEQILYTSPQLCSKQSQGDISTRTIQYQNSSFEDDIWSVGMITKELIDLELPQRKYDSQSAQKYIRRAMFLYSSHNMDRMCEPLKNMIQGCLKLSVKERATIRSLLTQSEDIRRKYVNLNRVKQRFESLANIKELSRLQIDILYQIIATKMQKQHEEWIMIFNDCDADYDGTLDQKELVNYLEKLYPNNTTITAQVKKVFESLHMKNSKLSQKEFIVAMIDPRSLPKESFQEFFKQFSADGLLLKASELEVISDLKHSDIVQEFKTVFKQQKVNPKFEDQLSGQQFTLYCKQLIA